MVDRTQDVGRVYKAPGELVWHVQSQSTAMPSVDITIARVGRYSTNQSLASVKSRVNVPFHNTPVTTQYRYAVEP